MTLIKRPLPTAEEVDARRAADVKRLTPAVIDFIKANFNKKKFYESEVEYLHCPTFMFISDKAKKKVIEVILNTLRDADYDINSGVTIPFVPKFFK